MLMRDERLATLRSQFDDASETLTILRDGKQVARGQLTTPHRPLAHRAVPGGLHEGTSCAGRPRSSARRPQLLRRGREVRAHRQPGHRARAGAHRGPPGRSPALPGQPLSSTGSSPGPSSAGWARNIAVGPVQLRRSRAPSAATRPMSTRPRARATWPSRPPSRAPGATPISASTPRSHRPAKLPWARSSRFQPEAASQRAGATFHTRIAASPSSLISANPSMRWLSSKRARSDGPAGSGACGVPTLAGSAHRAT